MSLHIITLGKAGLAAPVWDVIVRIASLWKGSAVTLVAENAQPHDAGRGLLSLPLGDALFQVSWKQEQKHWNQTTDATAVLKSDEDKSTVLWAETLV